MRHIIYWYVTFTVHIYLASLNFSFIFYKILHHCLAYYRMAFLKGFSQSLKYHRRYCYYFNYYPHLQVTNEYSYLRFIKLLILFIQYFNKLAFIGIQISKSQIIMGQLQIALCFFGQSLPLPWDTHITS